MAFFLPRCRLGCFYRFYVPVTHPSVIAKIIVLFLYCFGCSFFVVLRTEQNLGVSILYLLFAHGLCSYDDGSWILQNMC
jgi:hypothetical protein